MIPRTCRKSSSISLASAAPVLAFACALVLAATAVAYVLPARAIALVPGPSASGSGIREASAGPATYMVQVEGAPSALAALRAERAGASSAVAGNRAEARADANAEVQDQVASAIESSGLAEEELFRVSAAFNGIAVLTTPDEAGEIQQIEGVRSVRRLPLVRPVNAHSVPYINAPALWSLPSALTGQGIDIGVIDTGVDYVHRNFGGTGTPDDLDLARSSVANPQSGNPHVQGFTVQDGLRTLYPSAKVVGGFDFAGDAYNAEATSTATPRPDPNPMDCPTAEGGGHGTHVAGTAAGYGVNPDGTTFTGSYSGLDPSGMRIGPGVAPEARIHALRVFGCQGSSNLTVNALDWAMDPNGDGDPADRLDVVNLSLGSDFGLPDTPDSRAADLLSQLGSLVVISAGNGGNQVYQAGSPGASTRAITVANMVSSRLFDGIRVSGSSNPANDGVKPASAAGNFSWNSLGTPVAAQLRYPAANRTGCSAFSPADSSAISGRVVLLDWRSVRDDPQSPAPCGSRQRVDNAEAAGAVGVVIGDSDPNSTIAISGNSTIPSVYVFGALSAALRGEAGVATVSFERDLIGAIRVEADPVNKAVADSSSRGPGGSGVLKPDLAAPGTDIVSSEAGTGDGGVAYSGTSMAAPHVAGMMALLRQAHPSWTSEELKALAMNSARDNLFSDPADPQVHQPPQRVGTGTVDVQAALDAGTVAFASGGSGAVGVSLGPLQVPPGAPFQREASITVVNKENVAKSGIPVALLPRSTVAGAVWSLPDGNTVSLPPNGSVQIRVRLTVADPSALRNDRDPTLLDGLNRDWIAETSGIVVLTEPGSRTTRVPVYASLAPASTLGASPAALDLGASQTSGAIDIRGQAVNTGPTSNDFISLLTPLELQFSSPREPLGPNDPPSLASADLRDVGVAYDADEDSLTFGASSWADTPNPSDFSYHDVYVDATGDDKFDYFIYTGRDPDVEVGDSFGTIVKTLPSGPSTFVAPAPVTSFTQSGRVFDTDVMTMTVPRTAIGLSAANSRFTYAVDSGLLSDGRGVDETPLLSFDYMNPGLSFPGGSIRPDVAGALPFGFDADAMKANRSTGVLLLHHMNASGSRSEAIPVRFSEPVQVAISWPASKPEGGTVNLSANAGPGGPFTFDWDLGSGAFDVPGNPVSFTPDDGPATVTIAARATGTQGTSSQGTASSSVEMRVTNVPPKVRLKNVRGGRRLSVSASDRSVADTRAGFRFAIDFRADGRVDRRIRARRAVIAWPRGRKGRIVRVTATDKDGGTSIRRVLRRPVRR